MRSLSKGFTLFLTVVLVLLSLTMMAKTPIGKAQSGTNVNGIITSNTTWTQASSPYTFTGPVAVNASVALAIQPGVTVNIGTYYLQVNGTLRAIGDRVNPITFNGGQITFNQANLTQSTDAGCLIENAVLASTTVIVIHASPKIDNSTFNNGGITLNFGSPIISNNIIRGGGISGIYADNATISDNTISGCDIGIQVFAFGTSVVEGNLISGNNQGIQFWTLFDKGTGAPVIKNNIITNNTNGISFNIVGETGTNPIILNNTIYANNYNIYSSVSNDINATYNWWGTNDAQTINQTIYDFKNDFNLGNVIFIPFLTAPNTQTPTYINVSAGAGGSINPSGILRVDYGGNQSFTITPNASYDILNVMVNGTFVGTNSYYTVQNIQGATTIHANFVPRTTPTQSPTPSTTPSPTPSPTATLQPTPIPTQATTNPTAPTQTSTPAASSSPTPTVPELPILTIPVLLFTVVAAGLLVYHKKNKRRTEHE